MPAGAVATRGFQVLEYQMAGRTGRGTYSSRIIIAIWLYHDLLLHGAHATVLSDCENIDPK